MQPYVFPYIGYFQLINAVDKFVFYDDVNYIKGGWINRNKLLLNGKENLFTIPLNNSSSFSMIKDTEVHSTLFPIWKKKFLKSIEQSYGKTPFFNEVFPVIERVFVGTKTISDVSIKSIKEVLSYLELDRKFYISSKDFGHTKDLGREDRLVEICMLLNSKYYVNMYGGIDLYTKEYFLKNNIILEFLEPTIKVYPQICNSFISGLSIIDVLMNNSKENVFSLINEYSLK